MFNKLQNIADTTVYKFGNNKDLFYLDDMRQEILIELYKIASPKHSEGYYFNKARWVAKNFIKYTSRRSTVESEPIEIAAHIEVPDFSDTVLLTMEYDRCREELPNSLQNVFDFIRVGYCVKDISYEIGCSEKAVRNKIAKIKQQMKNSLDFSI